MRTSKRARLTVSFVFLAALAQLCVAIAANAVSSSFTALSPAVKAPFYLLPGVAIFMMLCLGTPTPHKFPRPVYSLLLLSTGVLVVGLLIGGVKTASGATLPLYYIGDSLKFFSSWGSLLVVAASTYLLCKASDARAEQRLIQFCFILATIEAFAVVALALRLDYWQKIHLVATPLIGFGLLYVRAGLPTRLFALLLGASAAALSGKRSGLAVPILASGVVAFILAPRGLLHLIAKPSITKPVARTLTIVGIAVPMGITLTSVIGDQQADRFVLMYESLSDFVVEKISGSGVTDQSMNSRYAENENVKTFYEAHPLQVLLGGGFGVETPMYNDTGVTSVSGKMHHVHGAWWVYLLRNGLLGVALLIIYFIVVSRVALDGVRRGSATGPLLLYLLIAQAAASYKSNTMLDSIEFTIPVLFGATLASLHRLPRQQVDSRRIDNIATSDRPTVLAQPRLR